MQIKNFYYITHINNIPSILEKGILAREKIYTEHIQHTPIADMKLVTRRFTIHTPDGKGLWYYVNLFFWPCNPMLYRLIGTRATRDNLTAIAQLTGQSSSGTIEETIKEDLAILEVANTVLQERGVCITNGNAISSSTLILRLSESEQVFHQQQQIRQLTSQDKPWISWKHDPDPDELKRKLMAECLVPVWVDPKHIGKLFVTDSKIADFLRGRLAATDVWRIGIQTNMFTRF